MTLPEPGLWHPRWFGPEEIDSVLTLLRTHAVTPVTVVQCSGVFDLLHVGHVRYFEQAKRHGTHLVVSVNTDASVARIKPGRPIMSLPERMFLLASLTCVDFVTWFEEDTPSAIIQKIKPNVYVKGPDYRGRTVPEWDVVVQHGRYVCLTEAYPLSTTQIIERITGRGP